MPPAETEFHLADPMIVTGNTAHTKPENRAFYPALDGLRAVAFLMVFGEHYLRIAWGWAGVDLFFVLSGFLITGILFDTRDDPYRVRNFFVRRTLRIFPLYYAVMLVLIVISTFAGQRWNWHWLVWFAYLGNYARYFHPFVDGDSLQSLADFQLKAPFGYPLPRFYLGHFWSLCVEEQFYLVWPWLVFLIRSRLKLLWICAATIPICLAMRLAGQHLLPPWMLGNEILYRATPFRLDALLIGGLAALVLRGPQRESMLRIARIAFPAVLTVVLLWLLFTPTGSLWVRPYTYPQGRFTWGLSVIDLLSVLFLLMAIQPGSLVYRVLKLGPLRWMGRLTYGAYLLHDIPRGAYTYAARNLVLRLDGGKITQHAIEQRAQFLAAALGLVSTFVLAWLSFRFFESPFLDLKERWTRRPVKQLEQRRAARTQATEAQLVPRS